MNCGNCGDRHRILNRRNSVSVPTIPTVPPSLAWRESQNATAAAMKFKRRATKAEPRIPNRSTSIISTASAPPTAPSVFQPYNRPRTPAKSGSHRMTPLTRSGSVIPIAVAGTRSSRNAIPKRNGFMTTGTSRTGRNSAGNISESTGSRSVRPKPVLPMTISMAA